MPSQPRDGLCTSAHLPALVPEQIHRRCSRQAFPSTTMSASVVRSDAGISPLFRLPPEIRRIIYAFALPFATIAPERKIANTDGNREIDWAALQNNGQIRYRRGHDVVWTRGCTALLAVSKQIHEETAAILYGDNTFTIDIKFDAIKFHLRWRTAQDLTPSRTYLFLEHFSQRNLLRIRHYVVNVEPVDEYMGMIKYNYGGQGLVAGVRTQMSQLARLMAGVEALQAVNINVWHSACGIITVFNRTPSESRTAIRKEKEEAQARTILAPLACVRGVRTVEMTGLSDQHMEELRTMMTAPKSEPASNDGKN